MSDRKIGIGISTYHEIINTNNVINSIKKHTIRDKYKLVVVDDGTTDEHLVDSLKKICKYHNVYLHLNKENFGIPATWNRLVELCTDDPEDIVILFNNDIIVTDNNWLNCIEHFINNNENIGTVGFPLVYPQDQTRERNWGIKPNLVGCAVGCCFGFKRKVWDMVNNIDGSTGFWEDLISFHEEISFGFELAKRGYYSYMLNFPSMIHLGGQSFQKSPELCEREIDWNKDYYKSIGISRDEYIKTIQKSKVYPENWKKDKIVWTNNKGNEVVDRMAFSRYMFSKYWNTLHSYDMPSQEVHDKYVVTLPKRTIKWLNENLEEMES